MHCGMIVPVLLQDFEEEKNDGWGRLFLLSSNRRASRSVILREDVVWIGRNKACQVVVDDPRISGKHCVIFRKRMGLCGGGGWRRREG